MPELALFALIIVLITSFTLPAAALADGIIIPDPIPCNPSVS